MVACTGFEPVNTSLRGARVKPLHQQAINNVFFKDIIILSGDDFYESEYVPEEYAKLNENIECISITDTSFLPQLESPTKVMDIIEEYWK